MQISPYHPFWSAKAKARYLRYYDRKAETWPVAAECRYVPTSYGKTFVRISGPAGAPPLLLLPGGSTNSLMWRGNIGALSLAFQTFAVDNLYDFGRSIYTSKPKCLGDILCWLDELINGLHLKADINLMGLSMGGWLAGYYALHFPRRVGRVVLLAPANTVLHIQPQFGLHAIAALLPFRTFTRSFIYWLFRDLVEKDAAGKELAEEMIDELFLALRCFHHMPIITPTVLTDGELQTFPVPALFLVGENEKIYPAGEAIRRLNRLAPQVQTAVIPHAGHDLAFVQAELVDQLILDFLLSGNR